MRQRGRRGRHALVVALAVLVTLTPPSAGSARSTPDTTTPLVFVHGYNNGWPGSCPSVDTAMWAPLETVLATHLWLGPKRAVGFYSCDAHVSTTPDDWIDDYGSATVYYASAPCSPFCTTREPRHGDPLHRLASNRNTDLRHLAYHLAWYLYTNFSRYGTSVQIVAHSMGGLIVRWMLYAAQHNATIGQGVFPPTLLVRHVYTISTPHNGTWYAWLGATTQAGQMWSAGSFIRALNTPGGENPQGTGGTTWTTMGNYPADADHVVSASSAIHMEGGYKVLFDGPTRYSHGGALDDTAASLDAHAYECDGCPAAVTLADHRFVHDTSAPHNDAFVDRALMSASVLGSTALLSPLTPPLDPTATAPAEVPPTMTDSSPTGTVVSTPTVTATATATVASTPTATATVASTPTATATVTVASTPTATATVASAPTVTATATLALAPTPTGTTVPVPSPSPSPSPSGSAAPSATPGALTSMPAASPTAVTMPGTLTPGTLTPTPVSSPLAASPPITAPSASPPITAPSASLTATSPPPDRTSAPSARTPTASDSASMAVP